MPAKKHFSIKEKQDLMRTLANHAQEHKHFRNGMRPVHLLNIELSETQVDALFEVLYDYNDVANGRPNAVLKQQASTQQALF